MKLKKLLALFGMLGTVFVLLSACSNKAENSNGKIKIVTTTNVYANIAQNIVGKYGSADAIITNSTTDPHDFEPTTNDAKKVADANIIVANGLGYDSWMNNLADSSNKKVVLVGEDLMKLKKGDNPHIWYNLNMPVKYVDYLVERLSKLDKKHASYFKKNGQEYLAKINKLKAEVKKIDGKHQKPVYVSEPVFDYALEEADYRIGDRGFEKAIENGTDPSPQMIDQMTNAIKAKKIAFFVNNIQASSSTVENFVKIAKENKIPVISVRETIPNHTSYLGWMKSNYQKLIDVSEK